MKSWATVLVIPLLASCLVSGCATGAPRETRFERDVDRADHHLVLNVLNRLRVDDMTAEHSFSATAENGVVTLYGYAPDRTVRMRAVAVVQSTPGVVSVADRMHPPR